MSSWISPYLKAVLANDSLHAVVEQAADRVLKVFGQGQTQARSNASGVGSVAGRVVMTTLLSLDNKKYSIEYLDINGSDAILSN
jgi:hypothetical protein